MNPNLDPTKQMQLMMNLSLLSSLNEKVQNEKLFTNSIPIFPQIIPQQTIIQPIQEDENLFAQLSYQPLINEQSNNTIFSYQNISDQNNPIKTSDTYYYSTGYYKPYTTMNYYINPLLNNLNCQCELLGKKTARNKIIINNENRNYFFDDNNIKNDNYVNNIKILNNDCECNKRVFKHYSAPIFKMNENNHNNSVMFETHLLKTNIDKDYEKKYKCKHPNCDLCYRTKKQLVSHHGKMDIECQRDTVCILELISNAKKLILNLNDNNKLSNQSFNHVIEKYENLIKNVSITDYAQMICGNKFNDIIISTQGIQNFNFNNFKEQIQKLNSNNIN
jgi:hypothetical protein